MVICQKDLGMIPEDRPSHYDHSNNNNNKLYQSKNNRPRYNVDAVGSGESSKSCLVVPGFGGMKKKKKKSLVVSSSAASTADQSSTADHIFNYNTGGDDRRGLLDSANRLTTNTLDWYTHDDIDNVSGAAFDNNNTIDNDNTPNGNGVATRGLPLHQHTFQYQSQSPYSMPAPQFVPPSPAQESAPSNNTSNNTSTSSLLSFPTPTDRSHNARRKAPTKHAYDGELEPEGMRGQEAEVLPVVSPEPSIPVRQFFQNDTSHDTPTSKNSFGMMSMDQSTTSSQDIQAMLRSDFKPSESQQTTTTTTTISNQQQASPPQTFESRGRQFLQSSPAMLSETHTPRKDRNMNRSVVSDSSDTTTQLEIQKNNVAEIAQQHHQQQQQQIMQQSPRPPAESESPRTPRRPEPSTPPTRTAQSSAASVNGTPTSVASSIPTTPNSNNHHNNKQRAFRQSAPVDVDDSSFQDPAENVTGIHAMAMEHVMRGEYDMALQAFSQVLKVYLEQHGRAHPLTASAYHNLGTVHSKRAGLLLDHTLHQRHCREQALLCFQAAARSARDAPELGPSHPNVAVSLVRIGFLLLQSRQYQNAVITFQEALRIRVEHYGATHGLVANLYNNLGVCHMHLQEFPIGRRYLQQALDIQKQLLAQDEFSTTALLELADTLCNIGGLCLEWIRQQGPDARHALDAESAFLEALEVRTKVLGEDHALTNQVRSLHDMVRSIPLPKLSPRGRSASGSSNKSVASNNSRSTVSRSQSPSARRRSTSPGGTMSPSMLVGRPYATASSMSPPRHVTTASPSVHSNITRSPNTNNNTDDNGTTPNGLHLPTLQEGSSARTQQQQQQRLAPPSPPGREVHMGSHIAGKRDPLSPPGREVHMSSHKASDSTNNTRSPARSVFSGVTTESIQMDRTVQSELGSSVFTSSDDVECYDASEESCLLGRIGDDQTSTVVSYAQTTASWPKSNHHAKNGANNGSGDDRSDVLQQAKAILDAHKDYMISPHAALIQETASDIKSSISRKDVLANEDGLAPLGGTWPAASSSERITQDMLQDPAKHLHTIQNCASSNMKRGRHAEALHLLELVLDCQRERNGMFHEDVGSALHNVGIAHLRLENHYNALQCFEEAVRVRKGSLGRDHPQVAVSLVKVGISLLLLKRLEDSLWIFREALTVRKHGLGALHPSTARIYNNIGCVHVEFQELKEARRAFEAALDIQRNALVNEPENGPILFGAATTLQNLGYLYQIRGMQEKAAMVLNEALTLQEKVLGDNHPTVLASLERLAESSAAANLGTASLKQYNELMERMYEEPSFNKLKESSILYKMSKVHKQNQDLDSQIGKLQLALKVLRAAEMSKERDALDQDIQKDLLMARQRLAKEELEWV